MKRVLRIYVAPVLAAALLWLLAHSLLAMQVEIRSARPDLDLLAGDRVWVWRPAYGLRLPLEGLFGYRRWGHGLPERGHRVAYTAPDGALAVARIAALPGDSVEGGGVVPPGHYWTGSALLPHAALVGRLVAVGYSVDASRPLSERFRAGRFFLPLR